MIQYIYIVDEEIELYNRLNELFKEQDNYIFKHVSKKGRETILRYYRLDFNTVYHI